MWEKSSEFQNQNARESKENARDVSMKGRLCFDAVSPRKFLNRHGTRAWIRTWILSVENTRSAEDKTGMRMA